MTKTYQIVGVALLAVTAFAATCKKSASSKTAEACDIKPTYAVDVKPIIDQSCGNTCHSNKWKADGIELTSYELVKAEAAKPRFLGALNHKEGYDPMPKKAPKLSDSLLKVIDCWIKNGSPE